MSDPVLSRTPTATTIHPSVQVRCFEGIYFQEVSDSLVNATRFKKRMYKPELFVTPSTAVQVCSDSSQAQE